MSTFIGQKGEDIACDYLRANGFEIIDRNWRTKVCEIDIVARKSQRIYFVEVKFRSNPQHGEGFDYITPKKLKQMSFSAEYWVQQHQWNDEYCLSALSVTDGAVEFIDTL